MEYKSVFLIQVLVIQFFLLEARNLLDKQISEEKIIGGKKALKGTFSHLVALSAGDVDYGVQTLFCGAALVTTKSVLTAAHCIAAVYDEDISALVSSLRGTVGTNTWKTGGQTFSFSRNLTYPQAHGTKYDLGFLFTSTCVVLSDVVKLVPLDFDYVDSDVVVKVAGWGKTTRRNGGAMSDEVFELTVSTIDEATCLKRAAAVYHPTNYSIDYSIEICTYHSPNHGTCNGDSGSPLIRTDKATLIGCVSWGFPCARGGPDMFVRFSAFKEWIIQNTLDDCVGDNNSDTNKKKGLLALMNS